MRKLTGGRARKAGMSKTRRRRGKVKGARAGRLDAQGPRE
jgi:hypothetical protein